MKGPVNGVVTPEHIFHMLDTVEKRTRETKNKLGMMLILEHDFEVLMTYARIAGEIHAQQVQST